MTIKTKIKQSRSFLAIRYSPLYLSLLQFFRPDLKVTLNREYRLYQKMFGLAGLRSAPVIFDLGANEGYTVATFLKLNAARVLAIDPDPQAVAILQARFKKDERVEVLPIAVGKEEGHAPFFRHHPASALNTLSEKWKTKLEKPNKMTPYGLIIFDREPLDVPVSTLDALIGKYGKPDFIKIDVEGYEKEALSGLSRPAPLIGFESNLPLFLPETIYCIGHLAHICPNAQFFIAEDLETDAVSGLSASETIERIKRIERPVDLFCIMPG